MEKLSTVQSPPPSTEDNNNFSSPLERSSSVHSANESISPTVMRPVLLSRVSSMKKGSFSSALGSNRKVRYADRVARHQERQMSRQQSVRSVSDTEAANFVVGDAESVNGEISSSKTDCVDGNRNVVFASVKTNSPLRSVADSPIRKQQQQETILPVPKLARTPKTSIGSYKNSTVFEYPRVEDDELEPGQFMSAEEARYRKSQARHAYNNHLSALYCVILFVLGISLPIAETTSLKVDATYYYGFYIYLYTISIGFLSLLLFAFMRKPRQQRILWTRQTFLSNDVKIKTQTSLYPSAAERSTIKEYCDYEASEIDRLSSDTTSGTSSSGSDQRHRAAAFNSRRRPSPAHELPHTTHSEHHGSFYLRLGAVLFGLAAMILTSFELGQFLEHISSSSSNGSSTDETVSAHTAAKTDHQSEDFIHATGALPIRIIEETIQSHTKRRLVREAAAHDDAPAVHTDEELLLEQNVDCRDFMAAFMPGTKFLFLFVQTYFVFVGTKVRVDMHTMWIRFGLMHVVGTNLCIWLHVLVEETKHAMEHYAEEVVNGGHGLMMMNDSIEEENKVQKEWFVQYIANVHDQKSSESTFCRNSSTMGKIQQVATPFLYPFLVEYSLIAAATLYVMWKNMGIDPITKLRPTSFRTAADGGGHKEGDALSCPQHPRHGLSHHHQRRRTQDRITVDIGAASRGLFFGLLVVVMTVISLVLFFAWISMPAYGKAALLLVFGTEIVIYFICLLAVINAMIRMRQLKFDNDAGNNLDDLLLNISQVGVYAITSFTIISGYHMIMEDDDWHTQLFALISVILETVQASLQTLFLRDATRRRPANEEQVRVKPARETVTFLLVCNIGIWALKSLEFWRYQLHPVQIKFYGFWTWTLLTHICTPLMIYYRFHSSVMLSEVWKKAHKMKINHNPREQ